MQAFLSSSLSIAHLRPSGFVHGFPTWLLWHGGFGVKFGGFVWWVCLVGQVDQRVLLMVEQWVCLVDQVDRRVLLMVDQ